MLATGLSFPELPKDRGPFEGKLVEEGFDAVTVSRVVGRADKAEWKEGTTSFQPEYLGQDMWGGYWYSCQQVLVPGYLAIESRIRVRTDLWRTSGKGGRLAWSGTREKLDPLTVFQAARELAVSVAKALGKAKLILLAKPSPSRGPSWRAPTRSADSSRSPCQGPAGACPGVRSGRRTSG